MALRFAAPPPRFPDVLTDLAIAPGASARHRAARRGCVGRPGTRLRSATARSGSWRTSPTAAGSSRPTPAFPRRWAGPPRLERLIVVVVDEPATKLAALTAGELDFAGIQPAHASYRGSRSGARGPELSAAPHLRDRVQHPPAAVRRARRPPRGSTRRSTGARSSTAISMATARRRERRFRRTCPAMFLWPSRPGRTRVATGPPLRFELLTVGSGEAPLEQMVQARLRAPGSTATIRQLELGAFLARVYGPAHDFDAAVLGVPGDAGLAYLGPLAAVAGLDGAAGTRGGAAAVRRLGAGGRSLSCARAAGDESAGARGDAWISGASCRRCTTGGWRRERRCSRVPAPVRLDFAGGWTDVPPFSAREGGVVVSAAIGLCAHAEVRPGGEGLVWWPRTGRRASSCPTRPRSTATGRLALLQAGLRMLPLGACTLSDPVRRATGLRARQLGRAGRRARGRAGGGARRAPRRARGRRARLPARTDGGRDPRRAAGPVHRRVWRVPATGLPRPRRRPSSRSRSTRHSLDELARRMLLCYTGASRFSGRDHRPGHGGVRAWRSRGDRRAPRPPRRRRARWRRRSWPATSPRIGALLERQLAASAGAGPRHVHAGDGSSRTRDASRPARWAARRRARGPAARCSSSAPTIPTAAVAAARELGMTPAAGALGRRGSAAMLTRRASSSARRELLGASGRPGRAARRLAERAAPLLAAAAGRSRRTRRCSPPTAASARRRRRARVRSLESRLDHRCSALRPGLSPASGTTAPGRAGSISGSRSGRRRWRRWPRSRGTTAGRGPRPGRSSRPTPRPISTIPTATTSSARAGSSSPPISSPSGSRTTSRPRRCSARAGASTDDVAEGVARRGRRGREPDRRVRRRLLQPADLAQRRARRHRRLVRGRGAADPRGRGADRHARAPRRGASATTGCGTRARTTTSSRCAGSSLAMGWARAGGGGSARGRPRSPRRLAAALRAPALTALPDHTFPARKDSRFGVSLAQPMYLELWEVGLARLGRRRLRLCGPGSTRCTRRPRRRPAASIPICTRPDGLAPRAAHARRSLLVGAAGDGAQRPAGRRRAWTPGNTAAGAAGTRHSPARRPVRLPRVRRLRRRPRSPGPTHLTLHAGGHHWLPDPGHRLVRDARLFWYRSTLAHNAPRLDGRSQPPGDAECAAFDVARWLGLGPRELRRRWPARWSPATTCWTWWSWAPPRSTA